MCYHIWVAGAIYLCDAQTGAAADESRQCGSPAQQPRAVWPQPQHVIHIVYLAVYYKYVAIPAVVYKIIGKKNYFKCQQNL